MQKVEEKIYFQKKEMYMTNTELLKEKIRLSGYRNAYLAECLGITLQAFLNKVNGKTDFKVPEMYILSELLKIVPEERDRVFFTLKVDEISTIGSATV